MITEDYLKSNAAQVMIDLVQMEINNNFTTIEATSRELHNEYKNKYGEKRIVLEFGKIIDKYLNAFREGIKNKIMYKNIFIQLRDRLFIDLFLYIDPDLEIPQNIRKKEIYQHAKTIARKHFVDQGYKIKEL